MAKAPAGKKKEAAPKPVVVVKAKPKTVYRVILVGFEPMDIEAPQRDAAITKAILQVGARKELRRTVEAFLIPVKV